MNNKEKLYWTLEVSPELYSSHPNQYMVRHEDYGLYSKRDATIICDFLRKGNLLKILDDAKN